jgi:hypothetical protein
MTGRFFVSVTTASSTLAASSASDVTVPHFAARDITRVADAMHSR